ncbi:MAG: hypothetical protein KKB20_07520 [Proteobacteria bacterium]|nr:hypothetical protein [Pseudomonadota bacterium]
MKATEPGPVPKTRAGLTFACFSKVQGWLDEVKVVFLGPSERLLAEDPDIRKVARDMAELDPPVACKMISDQQGISDKITEIGLNVDFVGTIISGFIKDGYVPMVF